MKINDVREVKNKNASDDCSRTLKDKVRNEGIREMTLAENS